MLAFYSSNDLREDGLHAKRSNGNEYVVHDDKAVLEFFAETYGKHGFVKKVCQNAALWGEDFSFIDNFADEVLYWYERIVSNTAEALKEVLG